MSAFRPFEIEAIQLMAEGALSTELLAAVIATERLDRYEYTGSGYFVTVAHADLPREQQALSRPPVAGVAGNIQAGFVVHLGHGELTLECHTWGEIDVPESFRDMSVSIRTPPDNYVEVNSEA